jgi:6-phosphogluconolactonase
MSLPTIDNGLPRFDLLWLGLGEDGHTLSLFPQHSGLSPSSELVVPIHESPKPPRDRISLSLRALQGTQNALVLASGPDKKQAVMDAKTNFSLPISLATSIIATHEGTVQWLVDKDAAPTD